MTTYTLFIGTRKLTTYNTFEDALISFDKLSMRFNNVAMVNDQTHEIVMFATK